MLERARNTPQDLERTRHNCQHHTSSRLESWNLQPRRSSVPCTLWAKSRHFRRVMQSMERKCQQQDHRVGDAPGTWYRALVRYLVLRTRYLTLTLRFNFEEVYFCTHTQNSYLTASQVSYNNTTICKQIMQSCEGNQARRLGKCFILFTPHGSDQLREICWKGNRFIATNCQYKALRTAKVLKVFIENGTFSSRHRHNGSLG